MKRLQFTFTRPAKLFTKRAENHLEHEEALAHLSKEEYQAKVMELAKHIAKVDIEEPWDYALNKVLDRPEDVHLEVECGIWVQVNDELMVVYVATIAAANKITLEELVPRILTAGHVHIWPE